MLEFVLLLALRDGVNHEGFSAIKVGMNKRDVVAIFGRPSTGKRPDLRTPSILASVLKDAEVWQSPACTVWIRFDAQNCVFFPMIQTSDRQRGVVTRRSPGMILVEP